MDNKVTSIPVKTIQWSKAMNNANNANKMVPLLNKKLAREELKKLMTKLEKDAAK